MSLLERWRNDPIGFIQRNLFDPETNRPFRLLPAEKTFLKYAFQLDDDGRLAFPEQLYGAIKKSGKTGFAGIHLLTTMVLFGGRYAEAFCCANDLEQASSRVFEMARRIVEASPLLKRETKITNNCITFPATGATIQALASDYASAAGGHPVISCFDELWGYTSERSRRLWDEMIPVPTRPISCRLTVTHAGFEGESLLLAELYKRGLALPEVAPNLHAGDGLLLFWSHDPIAPWQTDNWLAEMRRSLRPNQFARMIENRWVGSESAFIEMVAWEACVDANLRPITVDPRLPVWIGVDASVKRDSTAIVAVTYDALPKQVRLINHQIFQPSPERPIDFEAMVEDTIMDWSTRYKVRAVTFDPYQMVATAQRLAREGLPMQELPQTSGNLTETSSNLYELVQSRNLVAYPSEDIRTSIARAIAVETSRGWRIAKEKQSHKIDVVVALSMAALVCVHAQRKPASRIRTGTIGGYGGASGRITWNEGPKESRRVRSVKVPESLAPAARGP